MTRLERQIWQRWHQYHKNTAEIAKALNMEEHEVERIVRKLKDDIRKGVNDD